MKKVLVLIVLCLSVAACGSFMKTELDSACVEQGLTAEECSNAGTHDYQFHLEIQGMGGVDCSGEDGSTVMDGTSTYTFTFFEGEGVMYEHPDEVVWGSTMQPFMKTAENQYIFLGAEEDMLQTWQVEFFNGGFSEKLSMSWDCAIGTCGCVTVGEYQIRD